MAGPEDSGGTVEMSDEGQTWFEVQATMKIRAVDEGDAINRAAGAIRSGYMAVKGVYPVGAFAAKPCDDPLNRPVERDIGPPVGEL